MRSHTLPFGDRSGDDSAVGSSARVDGLPELASGKSSNALRLTPRRADEWLVTPLPRSSSHSAYSRSATGSPLSLRSLALVLGAIAMLCLGLLHATPARAVVSGSFGVQQRTPLELKELVTGGPLQYHGGPVLHSSDAYVVYWDPTGTYRGDWERSIDEYFVNVGAESGKLGDVFALDGQYADSTGRAANQLTFRGSVKDEDPYPVTGNCTEAAAITCLTDAQIQAELHHVITSIAPPLPGATGTPVYYILTPPFVTVCDGGGSPSTCSNSSTLETEAENEPLASKTGICGYHSAIGLGGASPIPYVVQPWVAGTAGLFIESNNPLVTSPSTPAELGCQDRVGLTEPNQLTGLNPFGNYAAGLSDVIINDLSIEQRDVVVNPFLNGWYQTTTDAEQGDMCQFDFGPPPSSSPTPNQETHAVSQADEEINGHKYYVSWGFDSADVTSGRGFSCWSGVTLEPFFTAPSPVFAGDIVGFNGTESDVTLAAKTAGLAPDEPYTPIMYSWNFGDGSTVSGVNDASVFHDYTAGGTYKATLTVTDSGGNVETVSREIIVVGPGGGGSGGAGGAGAGTGQNAGGTGSLPVPGATAVPAPIASASIVTKSLKTLKKGLAVRYSVNEQVAGRFEVLLSRSVARKLKIGGAPATGLPSGSAPQLVIAKAILVTTKGGHSTVHILLSKKTAGSLARAHKVSLMLRLTVRNAASKSPATTTVVSSSTLSR
jgi:PKD repeat protein